MLVYKIKTAVGKSVASMMREWESGVRTVIASPAPLYLKLVAITTITTITAIMLPTVTIIGTIIGVVDVIKCREKTKKQNSGVQILRG